MCFRWDPMGSPATTTSRTGTSPAAGFTLIELVLVAVVIAILLTAAVPRLQQSARRMRAEQAAFELAHLLRAAHEQAITGSVETVWIWDSEFLRARVERSSGSAGSGSAFKSSTLPQGLTVSLVRDGAAVECQCVRFFPEGTSEPTTLTVRLNEDVFTATVDETTSQVRVSAGPVAR